MNKTPDSEEINVSYQAVEQKPAQSGFQQFLSYLVFEGHGTRIGLELTLCVVGYSLCSLLIPWAALGIDENWSTLLSWFGCCFLVILCDQLILCRPVFIFRRAYLLTLAGRFDDALGLLEFISPTSDSLIRLPAGVYHLQRAEVYTYAGEFERAAEELLLAEASGGSEEQLHILRSRALLAQGKEDEAAKELEAAQVLLGGTSVLRLEEGIQQLISRSDLWQAKRIFREILELPDSPHFAGETTHQLAKAYLQATRLWTGEAEEGLEGISKAIDRFRSAVLYVDTLRPILSQLLLERSHYLATHREPNAAAIDLRIALAFCTHPALQKKSATIREELQWRHALTV